MKKYNQYNQVLISELTGCKFSFYAIKVLNKNEIYTLQDLFIKFEQSNFAKEINDSIVNPHSLILNEIIGTTKLLRCKYLDEDPKIPFYDPIKIDIDNDFGFSAKTLNTIKRWNYDNIKLFDMITNNSYHKLYNLRNSGPCLVEEIKTKSEIAYTYYMEKRNNSSKEILQIESLEELRDLFLKLEKLTELQNKTHEEIKLVQQQIKDKLNGKVMVKK